jgi:proteasome lid subunit RPN8/RPN11
MAAHARAGYPEECCGLLTGPREAPLTISLAHPCRNVLFRTHRARNGYLLDFRDLARVESEASALGGRVAGVFHSHVEAGAHFSAEDRRLSLIEDRAPSFADWLQIVLDVRADVLGDTRIYRWDAASNEFREIGWVLRA